jgi:hypothetical protein
VPTDDVRVLLFSIFFGAVMGWGFAREEASVQSPARIAMLIALAIGAISWGVALSADAASEGLLAMAAVSLTGGTAAGLITLQVLKAGN